MPPTLSLQVEDADGVLGEEEVSGFRVELQRGEVGQGPGWGIMGWLEPKRTLWRPSARR
jgi:hypothetical protein